MVCTDTLLGDVPFEGGSQGWKVQVAVDAAELLAGLDQAGGAPAQGNVSVLQFFTLAEWLRQMEIVDSMQLVLRRVRAWVGGTPKRSTVNVSLRPSRRLPAAPGWVCSHSRANLQCRATVRTVRPSLLLGTALDAVQRCLLRASHSIRPTDCDWAPDSRPGVMRVLVGC